jgi:hypothetical protein
MRLLIAHKRVRAKPTAFIYLYVSYSTLLTSDSTISSMFFGINGFDVLLTKNVSDNTVQLQSQLLHIVNTLRSGETVTDNDIQALENILFDLGWTHDKNSHGPAYIQFQYSNYIVNYMLSW